MADHNAVAHAWANQTGRARKGFNMFYDGDTIYSYGRHFPIARIVDANTILFARKGYSVSTAKHKCITARAIDHSRYQVFAVENVGATTPEAHLCNYEAMIVDAREAISKAKRARKYAVHHMDDAQRCVEAANYYSVSFDLGMPALTLESLDAAAASIAERAEQQRVAADIARAKAAREQALRDRERLRDWLNGAAVYPPHTRVPYVRVRGDVVETTWGASVPLTDALNAWAMMKTARATQTTFDNSLLDRIGDFRLTSITPTGMRVGCHYIPFKFAQLAACAAGLK